jgi:hypothetical protein
MFLFAIQPELKLRPVLLAAMLLLVSPDIGSSCVQFVEAGDP